MKTIDITKSVYELTKEDPELMQVLIAAGFTPLQDKKMLNTVGRIMSPQEGSRQIGITVDELKEILQQNGYEVKG